MVYILTTWGDQKSACIIGAKYGQAAPSLSQTRILDLDVMNDLVLYVKLMAGGACPHILCLFLDRHFFSLLSTLLRLQVNLTCSPRELCMWFSPILPCSIIPQWKKRRYYPICKVDLVVFATGKHELDTDGAFIVRITRNNLLQFFMPRSSARRG